MNKKTKALTTKQYKEIIQTMREGFTGFHPNERVATTLVLEGNLGIRILIGKPFVNTNRQETLNYRLPTVRNGIQNRKKTLNPGMIQLLLL